MNLLGIGYLTDGLIAAMYERLQTETYRVYETDCLRLIGIAVGVDIDKRYYDILHPAEEDNRNEEETASDRLERFGIKVVD